MRIVNLTSEGHRLAPSGGCPLEKSKLDSAGPWGRYGHSKLANILFTKELASRYPDITSVAVHPGVIKTDLYVPNASSSIIMKYGMMAMYVYFGAFPSPFVRSLEFQVMFLELITKKKLPRHLY